MENTIKFAEHVAAIEQDMKSVHRRLDALENSTESVHALANSIVSMTAELKAMRKDVNNIDDRLEVVEEQPKKRYEAVITAVISAAAGAVVGYLLKSIGIF